MGTNLYAALSTIQVPCITFYIFNIFKNCLLDKDKNLEGCQTAKVWQPYNSNTLFRTIWSQEYVHLFMCCVVFHHTLSSSVMHLQRTYFSCYCLLYVDVVHLFSCLLYRIGVEVKFIYILRTHSQTHRRVSMFDLIWFSLLS